MNKWDWNTSTSSKTIHTRIKGYKTDNTPVLNEKITTHVLPDFWTHSDEDISLFNAITPATEITENKEEISPGRRVSHGIKLIKYQYPGVNQGIVTLTHESFTAYNNSPVCLHIIVQQGIYFKVGFFNDSVSELIEISGQEEGTYTELCYDFQTHILYVNGIEQHSIPHTIDNIIFYINTQGLVIYDVYLDTKRSVDPATFNLADINEGTVIVNPNNIIYPQGISPTPIISLDAQREDTHGNKILNVVTTDDNLLMLNIYDGHIYYMESTTNGNKVKAILQSHYDNINVKLENDNLSLVSIQYSPLLLHLPTEVLTGDVTADEIYEISEPLSFPPNQGIPIATSSTGLYAYKYDTVIDVTRDQEITVYADSWIPTTILTGLGNLGESVTDPFATDDWIIGIYDDSGIYDDFTTYRINGEFHEYMMKIESGIITMYHDGVLVEDIDPYTPGVGEDMYLIILTKPGIARINVIQTFATDEAFITQTELTTSYPSDTIPVADLPSVSIPVSVLLETNDNRLSTQEPLVQESVKLYYWDGTNETLLQTLTTDSYGEATATITGLTTTSSNSIQIRAKYEGQGTMYAASNAAITFHITQPTPVATDPLADNILFDISNWGTFPSARSGSGQTGTPTAATTSDLGIDATAKTITDQNQKYMVYNKTLQDFFDYYGDTFSLIAYKTGGDGRYQLGFVNTTTGGYKLGYVDGYAKNEEASSSTSLGEVVYQNYNEITFERNGTDITIYWRHNNGTYVYKTMPVGTVDPTKYYLYFRSTIRTGTTITNDTSKIQNHSRP